MTSKDFKKLLGEVSNDQTKETFNEILAKTDPVRFLRSLVNYGNWPSRELDVEIQRVPFERQLIILINAFSLAVDSGGIEQLVVDPVVGGLFDKLIFCCKEIAASNAVTYLERMAGYFPQGVVPTDEHERTKLVEEIKKREQIKNFRFLNKEFERVVADSIEALRKYILARSSEFARVLSEPL